MNKLFYFFASLFLLICTHQVFGLVTYTSVTPWPKCLIPYVPNPSHIQWANIQKAMAKFSAATNIRFVARTNEQAYITFIYDAATAQHTDALGYTSGHYEVNIKYDVRIEHELGHVLGFGHEHERSDRDSYLDILTNNVDQSDAIASELLGKESSDGEIKLTNFDEDSIMIYWCSAAGRKATTLEIIEDTLLNRKQIYQDHWRTMSVKTNPKKIWGSPLELSTLDIQGIKQFYSECHNAITE